MNSFNKRIYEMLVRVLAFWTTYRDLIGKDSLADQLFQYIHNDYFNHEEHEEHEVLF